MTWRIFTRDFKTTNCARSWQIQFFILPTFNLLKIHLKPHLILVIRTLRSQASSFTCLKNQLSISKLIFSQELKSCGIGCCYSREHWRMWQKFPFRGNCCINRIEKKKNLRTHLVYYYCNTVLNCSSIAVFSWITLPRSKRTSKNNCQLLPSCLLYRKEHVLVQNSRSHFLWTAYSYFDSFMQSFTIQIEYSFYLQDLAEQLALFIFCCCH